MKKIFLITTLLVQSAFCVDFEPGDFYQRTQRPDVENIEEKFNEFKRAIRSLELSEAQKNKLKDLEKSFETIVTPPKYIVSWSQGPAFREAALEARRAQIAEGDWHESMSYLHESWDDISSFCDSLYTDPDIDIEFDDVVKLDSDEPIFVWNSIKKTPEAESEAYILYTAVKLKVRKDLGSRWANCLYPYAYNIVEKSLGANAKPVLKDDQQPSGLRALFKGNP